SAAARPPGPPPARPPDTASFHPRLLRRLFARSGRHLPVQWPDQDQASPRRLPPLAPTCPADRSPSNSAAHRPTRTRGQVRSLRRPRDEGEKGIIGFPAVKPERHGPEHTGTCSAFVFLRCPRPRPRTRLVGAVLCVPGPQA